MSDTGSGYSTPTSGFMRLPPIVTSESDRQFLRVLNDYIEVELRKVNPEDDEQRYIVYKTAFNKIIEHVTAYQPLLTTIKKEYEDTIEAIKKAQREATFLHGKLKAMASEPSTIRNYRKRGDELEERVNIVKKDNERLHNQLIELKVKRMEREKQEKEITEPPKRELKKDHRLIPGERFTDKELLHTKLEELDRQLKELTISFKTRYVPKTRKTELKDNLDNKVAHRDMLLRQGQFYKAKRQRLKVASEAAQAYNREKPPHQTVGDTVMMSLQYAAMQAKKQREAVTHVEDDDVQLRINGRTPLLMFCDALMPSAGSENARPDARLSLECVECALYENRLDLLSHWVAQKRLTFSEEIGHLIKDHCKCKIPCRCSCQALAQNVFIKLKIYKEAIVCLLKQGRVKAGLDVVRQRCNFSREDYEELLRMSPSIQLLHTLVEVDNKGERHLPIGCAIMNLMEQNKFDLALPFIQEMQNKPSKDDPHTSAFHAAVLDDHGTSLHEWNELVHILQDQGYNETAMGLLAAITVLQAMKNALRTSQEEFPTLGQSENIDVLS
ncbi:clathrin heavy chain linker domain-containing protein 1-like [Ruditapes philippinarum]|uniref:clathrin heavy chain linker domain-containing protein 1-like n=1 Tax=Ruditapes philippinarum TaxID=129788 RepID=UPI00295B8935|nr:clathrin heavy chain linker domain-containing protein 1-like [Ruditapes philippinarum]